MENICISDNINYFKNKILPYKFLVYTLQNEVIVIDVKEENLAHLLGINKSSNIVFNTMTGQSFYDYAQNHKIYLSDLVDIERFESNQLNQNETFIYEKNINFISLFESFINNAKLRLYAKNPGDDFDADYLHLCFTIGRNLYLGIIGARQNDFHYFNSVIVDHDLTQTRGTPLIIKNVEIVRHEDFSWGNYKVKRSKRITRQKTLREKKSKVDSIALTKLLNKSTLFNTKSGRYKKSSIQIYKNDIEIEKDVLPILIREFSISAIVDMIKKKNVTPLIEFIVTQYKIK